MQKAHRLVPVLAATWNSQKFKAGVGFTGAARPSQAQVQERQERQAELSRFDPDAVKEVLGDGLFWHYMNLCLRMEEVPPKLAAFGERCPCHGILASRISEYHKAKLMQRFFGAGITACPCAGMMGPELVAGELESHAREAWVEFEQELHQCKSLPNASPMNTSLWKVLLDDCRAGQTFMMALLKLKTAFWTQLTWILVGLAHGDETVARQLARKAVAKFAEDPRREVHHRLTWF